MNPMTEEASICGMVPSYKLIYNPYLDTFVLSSRSYPGHAVEHWRETLLVADWH